MAQQRNDYEPHLEEIPPTLPRYLENKPRAMQEKEPTAADTMLSWVWPVSAWIAIIFNTFVCFVTLRDMFAGNYSLAAHLTTTFFFCSTIGMLAFIHKFILMKDFHGPNN